MLNNLTTLKSIKSRSISPENFTGEKGKGGMATEGTGAECSCNLGQGWKISPSNCIPENTVATLADINTMDAMRGHLLKQQLFHPYTSANVFILFLIDPVLSFNTIAVHFFVDG